MPTLKRLCTAPGCGQIATSGSSLCGAHKARSEARRKAKDKARGSGWSRYGPEWRRKRKVYLRKHKTCVDCGEPATEVDHVVPLSKGGADHESNYAARCKPCHSRKTINEFRDEINPG